VTIDKVFLWEFSLLEGLRTGDHVRRLTAQSGPKEGKDLKNAIAWDAREPAPEFSLTNPVGKCWGFFLLR